jgi:hypothetical protein
MNVLIVARDLRYAEAGMRRVDEEFIKELLSNIKCRVCGRDLEPACVRFLGHKEKLWFLTVLCPGCQSQNLVAAVIKEGKAAELVAELSEAERSKFSTSLPIGADDVLDMHTFLEKFSGDFSSLFTEK